MTVNILLSMGAKIGEYLVAPVTRQFGYLIYYKSNLDSLRNQVNAVEERRGAVQLSVDTAKTKREVAGPDVDGWLTRVDGLSTEAKSILQEGEADQASKRCLSAWWCPNLKSRYSLSRRAKKKAEQMAKLHTEGNFSRVSYPAPPPGIDSRPIEGIKSFESRRSILKKVMEALKENSVDTIGICGMGGVGKTTLVKEVGKKAKEERLFDEVVMAVVSQNPERNIQCEIADMLGLKFEVESVSGRADRLREKLQDSKRVLVILDDVWKRLELNDIGIPIGDAHKGCKVVLTSRSEDVCNDMGTKKNFGVEVLDEEEAWNLFKEMAEITTNDGTTTQRKVAEECGGLPIAIVTVGRALKGKDMPSWDSALEQLRKSIGKNIREVEEKVFNSLELSYNFLGSPEAKKCFLLCSIYWEDFQIPIEDLVRYGIGLKLFEGVNSVGEARTRVHGYVDDLKKCFLLMDGEKRGHVKMHDVIRDVAISIASREENSFMVKYDEELKEWPETDQHKNWVVISMRCPHVREGLPDNLEFPKLQLLRLEDNPSLLIQDRESLYQGMKELKVVALSSMSIQSLPTSLRWLTNLQTLSLFECKLIDQDVSVIGALEKLEILSITRAEIKELPKEIGNLTRLKLLALLECRVGRICPGVLSGLSKLEELYLGGSFSGWAVIEQGKEKLTNACIAELASLPNLVALEIYVPGIDYWVWQRDVVFLGKLKKFNISLGGSSALIDYPQDFCYPLIKQLSLKSLDISGGVTESWLKTLFKIPEFLFVDSVKGVKTILWDLDEDGFEHLRKLSLFHCGELECLVNTVDGRLAKEAFNVLERLDLYSLPKLTYLWKGPTQLVCFRNLTSVSVFCCPELRYLFSLSIARNLVQLKELEIKYSERITEVIVSSEGEHEIAAAAAAATATDKIEFPKLTALELDSLPNFTGFCEDRIAIELPQLKSLRLDDNPKLDGLCPSSGSNYDTDTTVRSLFNNKDSLRRIEELEVWGMENLIEIWPGDLQAAKLREMTVTNCDKLLNILAPNSICMQNLEILEVSGCNSVKVTLDLEGVNSVALPCLAELCLVDVPNMTHVWANSSPRIQGFQNLRSLEVGLCPRLRSLCSPFVAKLLVKLEELDVYECEEMEAVVAWEQEEVHEEEEEVITTNEMVIFPRLTEIQLLGVPKLKSFCPQACTFEGSLLKTVISPIFFEGCKFPHERYNVD